MSDLTPAEKRKATIMANGGFSQLGKKAAETNKKKYGADFYKNIGKQGGTKTYESGKLATIGFGADRDLAVRAGHLGGKKSRRGKAVQ